MINKVPSTQEILAAVNVCVDFPDTMIKMLCNQKGNVSRKTKQLVEKKLISVNSNVDNIRLLKAGYEAVEKAGIKKVVPTSKHTDSEKMARHHAIAGAVVMMYRAGAHMPELASRTEGEATPGQSIYVTVFDVKRQSVETMKSIQGSRFVGVLQNPNEAYMIYNSNNAPIVWSQIVEQTAAKVASSELKIEYIKKSIVLVKNPEVAAQIAKKHQRPIYNGQTKTNKMRPTIRADGTYEEMSVITMDETGIKMLNVMMQENWRSRLVQSLFNQERPVPHGQMADSDGTTPSGEAVAVLVDMDMEKIKRLRVQVEVSKMKRFFAITLPSFKPVLVEIFKEAVEVMVIEIEEIMDFLGINIEVPTPSKKKAKEPIEYKVEMDKKRQSEDSN